MRVLKEVHTEAYGEHQGGSKLDKQLINIGYYWPTMKSIHLASLKNVKRISLMAIELTSPTIELHSLSTALAFS